MAGIPNRYRRTLGGRLARLVAAAGAALGAAFGASAECRMIQLSDMPLMMRGKAPMLDVEINGSPVRLLVDTGGFWSMIGVAKADELNLRTYPPPGNMRIRGIGGSTSARLTRVEDFKFGEFDLERVEFFVAPLPIGEGILGLNILRLIDVEFDLPNGRMRLFHGEDCKDSMLAYWAAGRSYSVVDLAEFSLARDMITVYADVNGKRMRALIDTGASVTLLSARAARRAGIDVDSEEVTEGGAIGGIGRRTRNTWIARLDTFEMGGQKVENPPIRVIDSDLRVDMIIGVDFLSAHRVLLSNEQGKIYFTYEGGPIFNSDADAYLMDEAGELSEHDAVAAADPTDAEGYASRGAARLSQGLGADALADFDAAIELEPENASHHLQRSRANIQLEQFPASWTDLHRALELEPDNVEALMMRARLHVIREEDTEAALADAQAASRAISPQSNLRLQLGHLFTDIDRPDLAISEFTQWIDAHKTDVRRPIALNGRCWARPLANVELDDALEDCNEAVRWAGQNPGFLDSRALVRLRRGEHERSIADYDSALELAPEQAWSLYGRAVAKGALGRSSESAIDLAKALTIDPDIASTAEKFGL